MHGVMFTLLLFALHDPADDAGDPQTCRCASVQASDGWCAKCGDGYYAAQRIQSANLFKLLDLHGHDVSAAKTRCATCREAIRAGGFCDSCNMGYVDGRGYFSRLCYHLARGRMVLTGEDRKPCCPHDETWCPTCKRGAVGNRVFEDERDFAAARRYHGIFKAALRAAARCETCGMAMIADSRCPACRVSYKDGKRIEKAGAAAAAVERREPEVEKRR